MDESKDALSVKCEVISVDRKRLTATYTGTYSAEGAAHPVNVFYANTVNLSQALDLGFSDFTDAYTMAGYVLSEAVEFAGLSAEEAKAVLEYRSTLTLEMCIRDSLQSAVVVDPAVTERLKFRLRSLALHNRPGFFLAVAPVFCQAQQPVLPRCINIPHFLAVVTKFLT